MTGYFLNHTLRTEASAILPVLDVLSEQVTAVSQEVETSIVEICRRFQGMAKRANDVVRHTRSNETDGSCTGAELVGMAVNQLTAMLTRLEDASRFARRNAETMSTLRNGLNEVFDALSRIEKISSKARIVALNGQMEAVRAGNAGAAFAEVANQTRELAASVEISSNGIRGSVDELGRSIVSTRNELETRVEDENHSLAETREAVLQTLRQLELTQERMEQGMAFAEQSAVVLSQEIGQAVVALQFQDAVCQRLAHVVYGLQEIRNTVEKHVDAKPSARVQRRTQELFEKLSAQYTIARERNLPGVAGDVENASPTSNVELF